MHMFSNLVLNMQRGGEGANAGPIYLGKASLRLVAVMRCGQKKKHEKSN